MTRLVAAGLCLIFTAPSAVVLCEEWPTYRHDNRRSGATLEEPELHERPAWVWKSGVAPVTALPGPNRRTFEGRELRHKVRFDDAIQAVICGQRVFFGSSADGRIICLDLALGVQTWEFFTGGAIRLAPAVWQRKVYAGSDDGWVYCLDAQDGRLIWKHRAGPAEEFVLARGRMTSRWPVRTGVLVADGVAYFGAGVFPHDRIYHCALDAVTGEVKWQQDKVSESDLGRNDASPQGYLLASDKYLFVPQGRDLPGALNMRNGGMVHKRWHMWSNEAQGDVGGTAALLADDQIYHFGAHQIMAMSQKRGDIGFGWLNGRQLVVAGEKGYLADGKKISRFNRMEYLEESHKHTAKLKRLKEVEKGIRAAKADPERKADLEKFLRERAELKKATRTRVIRVEPDWETPCPHEGELILAGNLLIAGGRKEVVALDASTGERTWKAAVEGEARGLASASCHLLVSTTAGHIYCYGPSTGKPTRYAGRGSRDPDSKSPPHTWEQEARRILALTGVKRGFCLLFGIGDGSLAVSLARASDLQIYAVDADRDVVAHARRALRELELLGDRVWVHHVKDGRLPYANYFADLVVSQAILSDGAPQVEPSELLRVLKPGGGVVCLPEEMPQEAGEFFTSLRNAGEGYTLKKRDGRRLIRREALSGVDWWTHQYGNPGNTASNNDTRVRGGLRVLWYGDPGAGQMINRHDGAMAPLCVNGRLFVQGRSALMAYDAYNGLFLWERENPKARKNGVKGDYRPSHIAANRDFIFMAEEDRCYQLEAATGREVHVYTLPPSDAKESRHWGVVGVMDGILYGTSVLPHKPRMHWHRLAGKYKVKPADLAFAFDIKERKLLWTYHGQSIQHSTVAAGEGHIFLVDSALTPAQRAAMLREPKDRLANLTGEARQEAEEELKRRDLRLAVSLHARTGKPRWREPTDVTDCSGVSIAPGSLVMMYSQGKLILCGADSNGHYWEQFLKGEFKRRKLAIHDASTGKEIWAKGANYRIRPLVVGDRIYAEPWAYRLADGELCTRRHPETKAEEVWEFNRPSAHCGMMTGAPYMLLFRAFSMAFYDLERDAGVQYLAGHRLGCWVNAIPAGGLVLAPESSAGCSCLFPISCTIVLEPAAGFPKVGKPIWRRMDTYLDGIRERLGMLKPPSHTVPPAGGGTSSMALREDFSNKRAVASWKVSGWHGRPTETTADISIEEGVLKLRCHFPDTSRKQYIQFHRRGRWDFSKMSHVRVRFRSPRQGQQFTIIFVDEDGKYCGYFGLDQKAAVPDHWYDIVRPIHSPLYPRTGKCADLSRIVYVALQVLYPGDIDFDCFEVVQANLLANPDFESGTASPDTWTRSGAVSLDTRTFYRGRRALSFQKPKEGGAVPMAQSAPFPVERGHYKITAALRTERLYSPEASYSMRVGIEFLDADKKLLPGGGRHLFEAVGTSDWREYGEQISSIPEAKFARISLRLEKTHGKAWVDAVEVIKLPDSHVGKRAISFSCNAPGNLFWLDRPAAIHIGLDPGGGLKQGEGRLTYDIRDYWGVRIHKPSEVFVTRVGDAEKNDGAKAPRFAAKIELDRDSFALGRYHVLHVQHEDGSGRVARGETAFAFLPEAACNAFSADAIPFGAQGGAMYCNRKPQVLSGRLGCRWIRLGWRWPRFSGDELLLWEGWEKKWWETQAHFRYPRELDLRTYSTVFPGTDLERGKGNYSSHELRRGMRESVKRYGERGLMAFKLGNEPNEFGRPIADNAVKGYRALYEGIKEGDPACLVIASSLHGIPTQSGDNHFFRAGYAKWCDVIDVHLYSDLDEQRETTRRMIAWAKQYGMPKPLWTTEIGTKGMSPALDQRLHAARDCIMKQTVFFADGGVHSDWFCMQGLERDRDNYKNGFCLFDVDDTPRLDGVAYYHFINAVSDKKFLHEAKWPGGNEGFLFGDDRGGRLAVLWNRRQRTVVRLPMHDAREARLIEIDGLQTLLAASQRGLTLGLSSDPLLLLFKGQEATLPETMPEPSLRLQQVPDVLRRDKAASLSVAGISAETDSVHLDLPPFWCAQRVAIDADERGQALFRIALPSDTFARAGRLRIMLQTKAGTHGVLPLTVEVAKE